MLLCADKKLGPRVDCVAKAWENIIVSLFFSTDHDAKTVHLEANERSSSPKFMELMIMQEETIDALLYPRTRPPEWRYANTKHRGNYCPWVV